MRIAINGFGRIGRTILRQILSLKHNGDITVVCINDIASIETLAYLFKYDSAFGPLSDSVSTDGSNLVVNTKKIPFFNSAEFTALDLSDVDVVLECTGNVRSRKVAEQGLAAGARAVVISGPSDHADVTAVIGANEGAIQDAKIVSNSSCTTNAIAPLLNYIDKCLGVERAHITTIHCYTNSQPLVDAPRCDAARSRAAAESIVPTTTSAAKELQKILPDVGSRTSISSVRVPSLSVSAIDATLQLVNSVGMSSTDILKASAENLPVIGQVVDPCVSRDLRARPESLILALPETVIVGDTQIRLFGWYDNEWGFSARMIEMSRLLAARP
ncbi:glyceraldehyde-3-phosphate dehydrogenase [Rhodobacterales bacterium 52_120_T64]|nr:glyceraldehyde-3-phosphate dehydrogenase [Rhodobacterales bacterium 52_120_T64]